MLRKENSKWKDEGFNLLDLSLFPLCKWGLCARGASARVKSHCPLCIWLSLVGSGVKTEQGNQLVEPMSTRCNQRCTCLNVFYAIIQSFFSKTHPNNLQHNRLLLWASSNKQVSYRSREAGTTKQDLTQTLIKLLTPCLCLCCCRNKTPKRAQHLSALSWLKMLTQVQTYLSTTGVISVTRSFMPRVTSEDTSASTVGKSPSVVTSVERLLLGKAT